MKNDFPTAFKLGGLVLAVVFITKMTGCLEEKPNADKSTMAAIQCENFVKDQLKAPSTADFPGATAARVVRVSNESQGYQVASYVDAQNSFGAKIRSPYLCEVEWNGKESADRRNWQLINLVIN
jgi:hypothetical protein